MVQVAGRFEGPVGVDAVVLSLPARIASAISTMMENIEAINSKVGGALCRHGNRI